MTDDTAARLRALESEERLLRERVKWHTAVDFPTMSVRTDVLLALLDALDEARRERDEQKRVIDDAYAALGGDAWWMDPPDGGSPTLAEMVAKANEDGRALYDVKRERDAAVALLREAQAVLRWQLFGECRSPHYKGPIPAPSELDARIDALLGGGEG